MRTKLLMMVMVIGTMATTANADFNYNDERFADLQMLRYRVDGFEKLSLNKKKLIYYLSEASICGRDIYFDQNCAYNLRIRQILEAVYLDLKSKGKENSALTTYLKRVWFSNGIHHHYGCVKFVPDFSKKFLYKALKDIDSSKLPLSKGQTLDQLCEEIFPVIFDKDILSMRTNQKDGDDLILTSAVNFYGEGVTQADAEQFYEAQKDVNDLEPVMYGLNSKLVRQDGKLQEVKWCANGMYSAPINHILYWLNKAVEVADTPQQAKVLRELISYYKTGDLKKFDSYSIEWVKDTESIVDFTNGFIESYDDPLGYKAMWEAITNFKDMDATERAEKLSKNAQWFEDNSPVDKRFKKDECKGISAKVIKAAMLGGALYPSTAIGINLPNSNWIRKEHGSKSVTIGNLTEAYSKAARGSGFSKEFVIDDATRDLIDKYGDVCDDLHTDLHECLGHGSGKMLPGVGDDSLKAYGSTIEETRADLFGLYYLADDKLLELGLLKDKDAYKSQYYTYMMNGLMTQLVRIKPGENIEEAHMRNRSLIAHWVYEHGKDRNVVEFVKKEGKTFVKINDYEYMRTLLAQLLKEIQRIKSEGDFNAARELVERYAVKVDKKIHKEVLARYEKLNIAPYKGFINPVYTPVKDANGEITDITISYEESYEAQMLRYSHDYGYLCKDIFSNP